MVSLGLLRALGPYVSNTRKLRGSELLMSCEVFAFRSINGLYTYCKGGLIAAHRWLNKPSQSMFGWQLL